MRCINRGTENLRAQLAHKHAVGAAVSGHGRGFVTTEYTIGLKHLLATNYDGREAPKVFQKNETSHRSIKDRKLFHGDHPRNVKRIDALNSELACKFKNRHFNTAIRNPLTYVKLIAPYNI